MRLLIFHNILFAQYKSIYFEKLFLEIKRKNGRFLVVQTSYAESSRLNHFSVPDLIKSIKYPYYLISKKPLEKVSQIVIIVKSIYCILKFKPTIVNFTGYNTFSTIVLIILCKVLRIKTIVTSESILSSEKSKNKSIRLFKKLILSIPNYFYTFGIKANDLLFELGVKKYQIINFGNTFDKTTFNVPLQVEKPTSEIPQLLFIGRLIPEKNLMYTLELLSKVNQNIKINFHIYGDGPLDSKIRNKIKEKDHTFAFLHSSVKWNELPEIYSKFQHLILLSNSETWGMVANEACHFNLSVICSNKCGCANDLIINHKNGLILESENLNENSKIITNYLNSYSKNNNFNKRNNLIFDESYAINRFIQKLYSI